MWIVTGRPSGPSDLAARPLIVSESAPALPTRSTTALRARTCRCSPSCNKRSTRRSPSGVTPTQHSVRASSVAPASCSRYRRRGLRSAPGHISPAFYPTRVSSPARNNCHRYVDSGSVFTAAADITRWRRFCAHWRDSHPYQEEHQCLGSGEERFAGGIECCVTAVDRSDNESNAILIAHGSVRGARRNLASAVSARPAVISIAAAPHRQKAQSFKTSLLRWPLEVSLFRER
jgi:hypothetical protein